MRFRVSTDGLESISLQAADHRSAAGAAFRIHAAKHGGLPARMGLMAEVLREGDSEDDARYVSTVELAAPYMERD